ncbi:MULTISPECIES: IS701 family transposase [Xanthomonas]|uniref:IS701 family transposase n=1 Tax=Xanthomonas TaxID=338 RepID=UPI001CB79A90|nr:IS701 family transposase [Xanthomonas cucurbitae]
MAAVSHQARFSAYLDDLSAALGHADRAASLHGYCRGLMLPLERKSVEPLAAHVDPLRTRARHQALHHFVAKSDWSDAAVLERVRQYVSSHMDLKGEVYWIVDDTGFRKKGKHSVGVTRQYCGEIGKQDNCQVAVSVSLATPAASVPMAFGLYLPEAWAADAAKREKAGVPEEIAFATKPEIALAQMQAACAAGVVRGTVLADAAYGSNTAWRDALTALELTYAVGIVSSVKVWPPGQTPEPPAPWKGQGRPAIRHRRTADRQPQSVEALAQSLPRRAFRTVSWREGSNAPLSGRFAALRVRAAQGDRLRQEEWLLIEWPENEDKPTRYFLSNLPASTLRKDLVNTVKARWRVERDYQDLKQEFGLDHYEGRGWRGFHHHATLCIAAYGFLVAERLRGAHQKKPSQRPQPALPEDYRPRGAADAGSAPCSGLDRDAALDNRRRNRSDTTWNDVSAPSHLMTQ